MAFDNDRLWIVTEGVNPPSSSHIVGDLIREEDVEHVHIRPVCDQLHRCIKHLQKNVISEMITKGDLYVYPNIQCVQYKVQDFSGGPSRGLPNKH